MTTTAIIASLNEEHYLPWCLDALFKQQGRDFNIILADSASTDGTRGIAKQWGVEIVDCPRGKLSAVDHAIRNVNADVFLLCDADRTFPPTWYNQITMPLTSNTVMVSGLIDAMDPSFFNFHFWVAPALEATLALLNHHYAGNTAIRRWAYLQSGGYDLRVNQRNFNETFLEEEFRFPKRLERFGRVVQNPYAVAYASDRRFNPLTSDKGFVMKKTQGMTF